MNDRENLIKHAWTELEAIVGREHIRPPSSRDAIDGVQPTGVIAPGTAKQVAEVLHYCSGTDLSLVPRGGGTNLGLGNPPMQADFVLSLERLNRVVEHAWGDMTTTVQAGCTMDNLQRELAQHGQRLALDPLWPETATVGGILATAESGTLRIRYGAVRDLVLGVEIALPDGTLVKAGGKVVKNVAGYDLTRLMIGSLGTLGVITQTVFRLHPIPVATATYSTTVFSTAEANKVVFAILDSHLVYTGLQIRAESASQIAIDARFEGIPESLLDQYEKLNRLAAGHAFTETSDNVWQARQRLFADAGDSVICKICVLPSQIGSLCDAVFRYAKSNDAKAALVAQATGLAEVRLTAERIDSMFGLIGSLRDELERLDGTLTLQQCPVTVKEKFDVWQTSQDAVPLMQQIKGKFDPARTLNRGRFVGAI